MFVRSNLAISLDGKIATASREMISLGTPYDRRLMQVFRKKSDVVLMGASTLGLIEVTATCARKRTAGAIDAGRFQQIEIDLLEDWKGLFQVDLTPDIVERSLDDISLVTDRNDI